MIKPRIVINELLWPDHVIDKIGSKHHLTEAEVEQAILYDPELQAGWAKDKLDVYGERIVAVGASFGGKIIKAYLYPTNEYDVWRINSAGASTSPATGGSNHGRKVRPVPR